MAITRSIVYVLFTNVWKNSVVSYTWYHLLCSFALRDTEQIEVYIIHVMYMYVDRPTLLYWLSIFDFIGSISNYTWYELYLFCMYSS